jgi:hypothetical protein
MAMLFTFHRSVIPESIQIHIDKAPDLTDPTLNEREGRALAGTLFAYMPVGTLAPLINKLMELCGLTERVTVNGLAMHAANLRLEADQKLFGREISAPWQDPEAPNG